MNFSYDETFFAQYQLVLCAIEAAPCDPCAIRIHTLYSNDSYIQPMLTCTGTADKSSVLVALTFPKGEMLPDTIQLPSDWKLNARAKAGAPSVSRYLLNEPFSIAAMPSDGEEYYQKQVNTKEELEAAIAEIQTTYPTVGWDKGFDDYLAAHDDIYFDDGAVVLTIRSELEQTFRVKGLTARDDGSWTLELCGIQLYNTTAPLPRPTLMAIDIHKDDLNGEMVAEAEQTDLIDLNGYMSRG